MDSLVKDFRHALRRLGKSPGFALLAVLPLAVGIGANATIFSFVNAVLLRTLPAERPEELHRLTLTQADGVRATRLSYADYADLREGAAAFSDLVAVSLVPVTLTAGEEAEQVLAEAVSGNFFPALGLRSALGRTLEPSDDGPGGERVAVVSHAFFERGFGGDPAALGRVVTLNGEPFTVVGVAAPEFTGTFAGAGVDVWTPIGPSGRWFGSNWRHDRDKARFQAIGRLASGATPAQAEAELDALLAAIAAAEDLPARRAELAAATLLAGGLRRAVAAFLGVATVMVGLVLLLACANVAHLLLARTLDRRRETAVRLALGAGRFRLGRQFLVETTVLSLLGGAGGLAVALWSAQLLARWNPVSFVPVRLDVTPDARVALFTFLAALATGVLLGLVPLLQAGRRDLVSDLKDGAGALAGKPRRARLRAVFLGAQIALSLVLLIAASLFLASLARIGGGDPGFDPEGALAMDLDLEAAGSSDDAARRFYAELPGRLVSIPGVTAASLADLAPVDLATARRRVTIAGHEPPPDQPPLRLSTNRIAPGYFAVLGVPLVAGRDFDDRDDAGSRSVAIVNETLASRFWPGEDPLGRRFRVAQDDAQDDGETEVEVVGMARDVKTRTLGEEPTPHFYLPLAQDFSPSMTLLVRAAGDPRPMIATVQRELQALDGDVQGFFARTLLDHLAFALLPARVAAALFTLFGAVALLLASVGIYGAVAYAVAGRTRELGIRAALGARRGDVVAMVVRESLGVVGVGVVVGLGLALALGRLLASLLAGVSASEPWIYAAVAALVLAVAALASGLPASRAARVDPLAALRHE